MKNISELISVKGSWRNTQTGASKVATRWTITAAHSGEFRGVPPTNRQITMNGIIMDRFKDGRVIEAWESFGSHGLMAQLGESPGDG